MENMNTHGILKCSCGDIIAQCKCFNENKKTRIVLNRCKFCGNSVEDPRYPVFYPNHPGVICPEPNENTGEK